MEHWDKRYCLEIRGDYACFTRPEMKVERVSYDVITPSAARAVFEAIFWKPSIRWVVRKIEILNPIQWTSVRRNEVGSIMSNKEGIFIEDNRQQRAGLFLRDVAYRIHADLVFVPPEKRPKCPNPLPELMEDPDLRERKDENPGKYQAIFERRARKGQCFNQPYLGCREFSVSRFRLVESQNELSETISETRDLGFMLYDLDFSNPNDPIPAFFRAKLENGVVEVPDCESPEVRR